MRRPRQPPCDPGGDRPPFGVLPRPAEDTLNFFSDKITEGITQDVISFFEKNQMTLRQETSIIADYYKTTNQNYAVRCQARSDSQTLIDLTLSVKTKEQAEAICNNWKKQHEDVYMYLMDSLMK